MLWCRTLFQDRETMLRHVWECPHLSNGLYWCAFCQKAERIEDGQFSTPTEWSSNPDRSARLAAVAKKIFSSLGSRSGAHVGSESNIQDNSMPLFNISETLEPRRRLSYSDWGWHPHVPYLPPQELAVDANTCISEIETPFNLQERAESVTQPHLEPSTLERTGNTVESSTSSLWTISSDTWLCNAGVSEMDINYNLHELPGTSTSEMETIYNLPNMADPTIQARLEPKFFLANEPAISPIVPVSSEEWPQSISVFDFEADYDFFDISDSSISDKEGASRLQRMVDPTMQYLDSSILEPEGNVPEPNVPVDLSSYSLTEEFPADLINPSAESYFLTDEPVDLTVGVE